MTFVVHSFHACRLAEPTCSNEQVSKEGDTFEVPIEIAKLSNLVVTTLGEEDDDDDDGEGIVEIPLPNVKSTVLAKVIEYCTHYKQEPSEYIASVHERCTLLD